MAWFPGCDARLSPVAWCSEFRAGVQKKAGSVAVAIFGSDGGVGLSGSVGVDCYPSITRVRPQTKARFLLPEIERKA